MSHRIPHTAFGRRLREELDRQQISVRELARRMNAGDAEGQRRTIARWLTQDASASVNPSRASVRATAAALGLEPSALLDDEEADSPLSRDETTQFFSLLGKAIGATR